MICTLTNFLRLIYLAEELELLGYLRLRLCRSGGDFLLLQAKQHHLIEQREPRFDVGHQGVVGF